MAGLCRHPIRLKENDMKKKLLSLLLLAVTLLPAAVSFGCRKTETPSVPKEEMLLIAENGVTDYTVIRPDFAEPNDPGIKGMTGLVASLRELGYTVPMVTDWTGEGGTPIGDREILVGKTNRPETAEVLSSLSGNQFAVRVIGEKIVIVGANPLGTKRAAEWFTANYITGKTRIEVPKDLNYSEEYGMYYRIAAPSASGRDKFDQTTLIANLQGIVNRDSKSRVYIVGDARSDAWLKTLSEEGQWLADKEFTQLKNPEELFELARPYVKKVIIWDPDVPASYNVAGTAAGCENGVVVSPELYAKWEKTFEGLEVLDLRGLFTGSETGSAKNDAYRWAIREYLEKGLCSRDFMCYYFDSALARESGDLSYVCLRDWAIYNRAFIFDLSPWGDEAPYDDPDQPLGTDLETMRLMLSVQRDLLKGEKPFEVCGFFQFEKYSHWSFNTKSKHDPVPTEWETVYVISEYGAYQNTVTHMCWNQSFHSQYEYGKLENNRPDEMMDYENNKVYLSFFMADYDSSLPLYDYLPAHWADENRGKYPLCWGIDPTLLDTYPDLISYYYGSKTPNDYFASDASAAGYFNPSRVPDDYWNMMIAHNKDYFSRMDLSVAPMVLDWEALDDDALDAFSEFAPDGLSTIIIDFHGNGGKQAKPFVYNGFMTCDELWNDFDTSSVEAAVNSLNRKIEKPSGRTSSFLLVRAVWVSPTFISDVIEAYRAANPDLDIEVVDIYNYYDLRRQSLE